MANEVSLVAASPIRRSHARMHSAFLLAWLAPCFRVKVVSRLFVPPSLQSLFFMHITTRLLSTMDCKNATIFRESKARSSDSERLILDDQISGLFVWHAGHSGKNATGICWGLLSVCCLTIFLRHDSRNSSCQLLSQ